MDLSDSSRGQNAHARLSRGKGKQPASLTSRIASSTTDMVRDLVGSSSASDLTARAPPGSGLRSKLSAASASTATTSWQENLPARTGRPTIQEPRGSAHSSFRSSPTGEYRNQEFDDFSSARPISPGQEDFMPTQHSWVDHADLNMLLSEPRFNANADFMDVDMEDTSALVDSIQPSERWNATDMEAAFHGPGMEMSSHAAEASSSVHLDADQFRDFLSESGEMDGQAISRLRMILGHVADTAQSSSTGVDYSFSQMSLEALDQQQFAAASLNSRYAFMEQSSYAVEAARQNLFHQQQQATSTQQHAHKHHHEPARRDSPMADQGMDDEELSAPEFHCPWIRCHQNFNHSMEYQDPSSVQGEFSCPHHDCTARFPTHGEWAQHVTEPHHDLLEFSVRTPISSEE